MLFEKIRKKRREREERKMRNLIHFKDDEEFHRFMIRKRFNDRMSRRERLFNSLLYIPIGLLPFVLVLLGYAIGKTFG